MSSTCCDSRSDGSVKPSADFEEKVQAPAVEMAAIGVEIADEQATSMSSIGGIKPRASMVWLGQIIASTSWIISVILYENEPGETWSEGDRLQMTAACAWTVSNLFGFPDIFE